MPQRSARTKHHLRWFMFAVLLVVPLTATAGTITVDDYHDKVHRAVVALDTLQQADEAEQPSAYEARFEQTLNRVGEALPDHETVQTREGTCNVDNSWLHAALKDLRNAKTDQRATKLSQLIERLQAVEERVKTGEVTPATDKAQTKGKLESILRRPEYETKAREESALSRLLLR